MFFGVSEEGARLQRQVSKDFSLGSDSADERNDNSATDDVVELEKKLKQLGKYLLLFNSILYYLLYTHLYRDE